MEGRKLGDLNYIRVAALTQLDEVFLKKKKKRILQKALIFFSEEKDSSLPLFEILIT